MDRTGTPAAIALVLVLAAVVAACVDLASQQPDSPTAPATPPPIEPPPVTVDAAVVESPWGPIWNAVPDAFLLFPGARPVEIEETVSVALDHPAQAASPADVANAYVTAMTAGGWRTVVDGPIEDGSVVVDAVRDRTSCGAQVRATPLGGFVRVTVLYGAGCPRP